LDRDELSRQESSRFRPEDVGSWIEKGLAIEAGFEVWSEFLREQGGGSTVGKIQYGSQSALVQAIVLEEKALECLAVRWNPHVFVEQIVTQAKDVTKGSEHHVLRFTDALGKRRVLKATFPKKYGRYEYSPTIYLNSLRLVQTLVSVLDLRLHGVLPTAEGPSIVTSMSYIPGRHPRPSEVANYLHETGWHEYHDGSQTLDYINSDLRQIIRDGHANNWVRRKDSGLLIPIDISIEEV
jgi:hypothetical protein